MTRRKQHAEGHENLERWLLTYADMITLLTAFFLMLYSMSVMSKGKFAAMASSVRSGFGGILQGGPSILNGGGAHTSQMGVLPDATHEQYEQAMRNLRQFVEQNKLKGKVTLRADERGMIITLLSDNLLFGRGQAALNPKFTTALDKVAQIIQVVPNDVQIEGHTCDLPIHTAQFPSNWELSTARAGAVLRYFTERRGLPSRRFMAAGCADTRPLVPNTSEEARVKNRRVDIVLLKTESQRTGDLLRKAEIQRITAQAKTTNPGTQNPSRRTETSDSPANRVTPDTTDKNVNHGDSVLEP